jgi:Concanavalin A-like lectin/glucanases superfamily
MARWLVFGIFGILAACGSNPAPADAPEPGPDEFGRILHYTFDDDPTDGVMAAAGPDARCTHCPELVAGRTGGAYEFSGAGTIVFGPPPRALAHATQVSAAVWVRPADVTAPQTGCLVGQVRGDQELNSWQVCLSPGVSAFVCMDQGNCAYPTNRVPAGEWHQIAFTFDGATMRLYLDATELFSGPATLAADNGQIVVGADIDYGGPLAYFRGTLDDVRVWNVALSPADIAAELTR